MQNDRKKKREWSSWGGGDVPCIFRCEWTTTEATYDIGKSTLCNFCIIDVNDAYNRCHVILILMLRYHMLDANLNVKMKANRKLTNIRIELSQVQVCILKMSSPVGFAMFITPTQEGHPLYIQVLTYSYKHEGLTSNLFGIVIDHVIQIHNNQV